LLQNYGLLFSVLFDTFNQLSLNYREFVKLFTEKLGL